MTPQNQPAPTVGRIVHLHILPSNATHSAPLAAIITGLNVDGTVSLHAYKPEGGSFDAATVAYSAEPSPNHWSWPPRA